MDWKELWERFQARLPYVDWDWYQQTVSTPRLFPWSPVEVLGMALQVRARTTQRAEQDLMNRWRETLALSQQIEDPDERSEFLREAHKQISERARVLGVTAPEAPPTYKVETSSLKDVPEALDQIRIAVQAMDIPQESKDKLLQILGAYPIRVVVSSDGRRRFSHRELQNILAAVVSRGVENVITSAEKVEVTYRDEKGNVRTVKLSPEQAVNYHLALEGLGLQREQLSLDKRRSGIQVLQSAIGTALDLVERGADPKQIMSFLESTLGGVLKDLGMDVNMTTLSPVLSNVFKIISGRITNQQTKEKLELELLQTNVRLAQKQLSEVLPRQLKALDDEARERQERLAIARRQLAIAERTGSAQAALLRAQANQLEEELKVIRSRREKLQELMDMTPGQLAQLLRDPVGIFKLAIVDPGIATAASKLLPERLELTPEILASTTGQFLRALNDTRNPDQFIAVMNSYVNVLRSGKADPRAMSVLGMTLSQNVDNIRKLVQARFRQTDPARATAMLDATREVFSTLSALDPNNVTYKRIVQMIDEQRAKLSSPQALLSVWDYILRFLVPVPPSGEYKPAR